MLFNPCQSLSWGAWCVFVFIVLCLFKGEAWDVEQVAWIQVAILDDRLGDKVTSEEAIALLTYLIDHRWPMSCLGGMRCYIERALPLRGIERKGL